MKPEKLGGSVCSRLVAWAASGINRQMVSHVLKNGRIRRGSYGFARNFITAFLALPRPLVDSTLGSTEPNKRKIDAIVGHDACVTRV